MLVHKVLMAKQEAMAALVASFPLMVRSDAPHRGSNQEAKTVPIIPETLLCRLRMRR